MKSQLIWCVIGVLYWANVALAQNATDDNPLEGQTVTIAGQEGKVFHALQEALDAAPSGAILNLSAGRFNERVTINKPVTLVGADTNSTMLGPNEGEQEELWDKLVFLLNGIEDTIRAAEQANPRRELTEAETEEVKRSYKEMQRLGELSLQPVVLIEGTDKVELRSLRVTMPLTPHEGNGLQVTAAVTVKNGRAKLVECAIVGCMSDGVRVAGTSQLEIVKSLIAACWGTGVRSIDAEATVRIIDSDIRNNYHYNISLRSDSCVIEGCRISGTAWSGISCGGTSPRIVRNVLFHNSRGIYSAGSEGMVKHNLIYQNRVAASCWSSDQPLYEGNLFLENGLGTVNVNGPGEPRFRNNLFVGSLSGVQYGPMKIARGDKPPAMNFHLDGNVFWRVETPVVLRKSHDDHTQDEPLVIVGNHGNCVADPHAVIDDQRQVVIGDEDIARRLDLKELQGLSLGSRWSITPEETAMIPDDGTVESSKWKKRPKL